MANRGKPSVMFLFVSIILWALGNLSLFGGLNSQALSGGSEALRPLQVVIGGIFVLGTLISVISYYGAHCRGRYCWAAPCVGLLVGLFLLSTFHLLAEGASSEFTMGLAIVAMWVGIHSLAGLLAWGVMSWMASCYRV